MSKTSIKWRFLIVEDKADIAEQIQDALSSAVDAPDRTEGHVCPSFDEAIELLETERFDILILDLKDDNKFTADEHDISAGIKLFERLKLLRFIPVVFYSAHAYKIVDMQTSFVRVVEKTEGVAKLVTEIKKVLSTYLPILARRIEDVQRAYMWDFVSNHWQEFESSHDQADIAYLMARRLALSLHAEAKTFAHKISAEAAPSDESEKIHPMEMYVRPPLGPHRLAGDLLKETQWSSYWIIMTPSCDFAQGKASNIVLAKCEKLSEQTEYTSSFGQSGPPSKTKLEGLEKLIKNNRRGQSERYKFLPGTYFVPDLVVDFQQLKSVSNECLVSEFEPIASLDSPFAESLLAGFSRYFGRLGTPDIDEQVVLKRLQSLEGKADHA
ncbi:MAG: hypothetical protein PHR19_08525 [Bacteroidales bacterium]|nr:hypothetical protein [Bacteroidales bacterium]